VSLRLAADGFHVVINFVSRVEAAEETAAAVRAAGGEADLLRFDVSDRAETRAALAAEMERAGPFYGVVLNAGVTADAPFPSIDDAGWDRVLRTNLDGFYNVVQPLVMPMLRTRQGGRIVTLSSVSGVVGNRGQVNYSASKAGLIGATRSLAIELAKRKITANSVAPGFIETELTEGLEAEAIAKLIPMRRLGTPEDVAAVVSFLFSDGAGYVTGQVISVNGGMV
jgi:3-oxoacyl-[acyl-carrier protein] reductase